MPPNPSPIQPDASPVSPKQVESPASTDLAESPGSKTQSTKARSEGEKVKSKSIAEVKPVIREAGLGVPFAEIIRYLARTDVHTYAFSVAANTILSLFPFIVLLLTLTRAVFHSRAMEQVVAEMLKSFLPTGQDFVLRNMQLLAHPRKSTQFFSLFMLLVTSTGVFLPLEVALNSVWGVKKNRSYLRNQAVSLGLAFGMGALAMASVAFTSSARVVLTWVFFGHTENIFFAFASFWFLQVCAVAASILLFFFIYWILPNRKVPARAVLPTAIVVGLLWELAKVLYIHALPLLDFQGVYGPFYISVGLMMWAFLSGLLLLAGAHFSATRYTLRMARQSELEENHAIR
ncbi:YihY/virulence factor BrkB family protein [Edaphobacter bradus]|uniref:YihY/virulence factor BrkB family protein n=1 Tax=Edaphobacter bradus TaxID=2259016 RepID=UPI00295B6774|nr:YihY/virulence factor BrkB family protein [Edaphobacter bradus]